MAHMNEKTSPFGIRLTPNERRALDLLATRWSYNPSETLRECLRRELAISGFPDLGMLPITQTDLAPLDPADTNFRQNKGRRKKEGLLDERR
jgi:hypothetical protein